jgi:hypothetical protein
MIDQQLAAFLEDGVGIHIGTRNEHFQPNGARAIAAKVEPDGKHLLVYITSVAAARVLPDLESNGHAAIVFARPVDERACQVKGIFLSQRPVDEAERDAAAAQWKAFGANLDYIGVPLPATWLHVPDLALRIRVTALFEQTPGPQAGHALA